MAAGHLQHKFSREQDALHTLYTNPDGPDAANAREALKGFPGILDFCESSLQRTYEEEKARGKAVVHPHSAAAHRYFYFVLPKIMEEYNKIQKEQHALHTLEGAPVADYAPPPPPSEPHPHDVAIERIMKIYDIAPEPISNSSAQRACLKAYLRANPEIGVTITHNDADASTWDESLMKKTLQDVLTLHRNSYFSDAHEELRAQAVEDIYTKYTNDSIHDLNTVGQVCLNLLNGSGTSGDLEVFAKDIGAEFFEKAYRKAQEDRAVIAPTGSYVFAGSAADTPEQARQKLVSEMAAYIASPSTASGSFKSKQEQTQNSIRSLYARTRVMHTNTPDFSVEDVQTIAETFAGFKAPFPGYGPS